MSSKPREGPDVVRVDEETGVRIGQDELGEYTIDDKIWTMNEIRDHPMFMEDINPGVNIEENPMLLALQSLTYDDKTPEEIAEHFRTLGNEAFRNSTNAIASQNALLAYTRGIEEECKDKKLHSQLHSNRAAVSLRLKEYDKAVNDCALAVKFDPDNIKAHFRGAKASEALGLTARALKFCEDGLRASPEETELKQLRKRLQETLSKEDAARQKDRRLANEAAQARGFGDIEAQQILGERGVQLGPALYDMAMYARGEPWKPRLAEDGVGVEWALLFLYDETNQSDFVQCFDERCTLNDQLELMFPEDRPVDWDDDRKYKVGSLVLFLEFYPEGASETSLMRIDATTPLVEVLRELCVPPCLALHVLVEGTAALKHFCKVHELAYP